MTRELTTSVETIRAMVEQKVREADSRKRSAIAKAVWARRKANPAQQKGLIE